MAKKLQVKLQDGTMKDIDMIATHDGDGNNIVDTYVQSDDSRLSNARTPTAHTHTNNDLTGIAAWAKAVNKPTYTKSEVGLSNVQNYGLATQAEAEAGSSTTKYMTPLRTKQAIEKLAGGSDIEVINSLTSTSTTAALSANQGRVLNNKIDAAIQAAIQNTWNGEY